MKRKSEKEGMYMKKESSRLYLRESTFDDCRYFAEWETKPAVTEFFTINAGRDYEEVVREFLGREGDETQVQFTVCLKADDRPVGRIYISRIDEHYDSLDITRIYIADPAMRGKGLGEEALRLALAYAFEDRGCERVTLDYFTGNRIASTLYQKVGFQNEGNMRHGGKKNGEYVDLHLMSMLRNEYFAGKQQEEKKAEK